MYLVLSGDNSRCSSCVLLWILLSRGLLLLLSLLRWLCSGSCSIGFSISNRCFSLVISSRCILYCAIASILLRSSSSCKITDYTCTWTQFVLLLQQFSLSLNLLLLVSLQHAFISLDLLLDHSLLQLYGLLLQLYTLPGECGSLSHEHVLLLLKLIIELSLNRFEVFTLLLWGFTLEILICHELLLRNCKWL